MKTKNKQQDMTIWGPDDALDKALKALAIIILIAIIGFTIFVFCIL